MKKLSVSLLAFIMCSMLWACGKTTTSVKESEEKTTTVKKEKTEYATTAADKKTQQNLLISLQFQKWHLL